MSAKELLDKLKIQIVENLSSGKEPLFEPAQLVELAKSEPIGGFITTEEKHILCQLLEAFIEVPKAFNYILKQLEALKLSHQLVSSFGEPGDHSFDKLLIALAKRESSNHFDEAFDLAKRKNFTDMRRDPGVDNPNKNIAFVADALHGAGHTLSRDSVFNYTQEKNLFTSILKSESGAGTVFFSIFLRALSPEQQKTVYLDPAIQEDIQFLLMTPIDDSSNRHFARHLASSLSGNPELLEHYIKFILENIETCLTPLAKIYKKEYKNSEDLLHLLEALASSNQFQKVFDTLIDKIPNFMETLGEIVILGNPISRRSFAEKQGLDGERLTNLLIALKDRPDLFTHVSDTLIDSKKLYILGFNHGELTGEHVLNLLKSLEENPRLLMETWEKIKANDHLMNVLKYERHTVRRCYNMYPDIMVPGIDYSIKSTPSEKYTAEINKCITNAEEKLKSGAGGSMRLFAAQASADPTDVEAAKYTSALPQ